MTEAETWRPCVGYEGRYEVSSMGRVRSFVCTRTPHGSILCLHQTKKKYQRLSLTGNGCSKGFFVHRLVASAFLPNPEGLSQVNHKDGNPSNNRADNLEWCTPLQNRIHRHEVLGRGVTPVLVFTPDIGHWYPTQKQAAHDLGIRTALVAEVVCGRQPRTRGRFIQYARPPLGHSFQCHPQAPNAPEGGKA